MKAMILAAGRGLRMRPLTDETPKPLLVVHGQPLIVHQIKALAKIGVRDIVINISYLAEKIQSALGNGKQFKVNIRYSFEEEALNTGGGIFRALPILGDEPFIVLSSDIFTDYPLMQLLKFCSPRLAGANAMNRGVNHLDKTLAHLVVVPNPSYHPMGDFAIQTNKDGQEQNLLLREGNEKFTFGSIGVLHPQIFQGYPIPENGLFPIGPILFQAIDQGLVTGECYQGLWFNVGTPEQLTELNNFSIE
jgi:MurNAc alpha-1-phosphate uridylyltransferase